MRKMKFAALTILSAAAMADEKPKAPTLSPADRIAILSARIRAKDLAIAALQSPAYVAVQIAQAEAMKIEAEAGQRAGCRVDPQTVECVATPK